MKIKENSSTVKCFFNSNSDPIKEIIDCISNAKSEIHLMHFWFSWKPIADALISAHSKGVKINILTDQRSLVKYMQDDKNKYSLSVLEYLFKNGIKRIAVFFDTILHHKVIIIDDILINGSLNLFKKSIYEDIESIMIIKNQKICQTYIQEFELIFKNSLEFTDAKMNIKDELT